MPLINLDKPQCQGVTQLGEQCKNTALKGTDYCAFHTPVTKEEKYSIEREIEVIINHIKRLRTQYEQYIKDGDDLQANMAIKDIADFAKIKTDLIKRNQDTLENLADLIPISELEFVIKEVIQILDVYLADQPDLLFRIKSELITQDDPESTSKIDEMINGLT